MPIVLILARLLLFFTGALFVAYGVVCLFNPLYPAAEAFGLSGALPPQGLTELRAMYGGLQISFGLLALFAAFCRRWVRPLLWLLLIVIGSLAAARAFGAWLDHSWNTSYIQYTLIYEWSTAILAALALKLLPRASA